MSHLFDERAAEAVLPPSARGPSRGDHDSRCDGERQTPVVNLARGRKRRGEKVSHPRPSPSTSRQSRRHGKVGVTPSSVLHPGFGRRKAAGRHCHTGPRSGCAGRSQAATPRDPGIGRPTGARVRGRLQRSTRSIFRAPREASREASRSRGEVARQLAYAFRRGACRRSRERVLEANRANVKGSRVASPVARPGRVEGRRPGFEVSSRLTGAVPSRALVLRQGSGALRGGPDRRARWGDPSAPAPRCDTRTSELGIPWSGPPSRWAQGVGSQREPSRTRLTCCTGCRG
jgi:hypothetical protein